MEIVWVESHPECSVCLQPCLHPVQTPCLHIFCFLCLKGFVYRSRKCALCRSEVKLEYFENPFIVCFYLLLFLFKHVFFFVYIHCVTYRGRRANIFQICYEDIYGIDFYNPGNVF